MKTNIPSRQYKPPQAPPPLDEGYWSSLLTQEENYCDETHTAEDPDWQGDALLGKEPPHAAAEINGVETDWIAAQQAHDTDTTIHLDVIGHNKGGLLVEWRSLRGFVPASQLVEDNTAPEDIDLEEYIGQRLALRVIEIDAQQNRLIFSERAAQVMSGTRSEIFTRLQPEGTCHGVVTNICDFGIFVDLGGVEGLIHISELSWGRVEHPADVLHRGQRIQVYIMDISQDEGRIALSLKRLQTDPWLNVTQRYVVDTYVTATITSVVDFGAFAALEEGLEGLIHISELAEGHFLHPRNVVNEGATVRVKILNIDTHARRIGLSLRK